MFNQLKIKLQQFMTGRYGSDQLSRFMLGVILIIMLVSMFLRSGVLNFIIMALLAVCYIRMFSKNHQKRYAENQKFLNVKYKITGRFGNLRRDISQRKTHHIYHCPSCGQKIRIPRGKGKICVTCPKCRTEFTKRS